MQAVCESRAKSETHNKSFEKRTKKFLTKRRTCDRIKELKRKREQSDVPCKLNNVKMTFITLDKLRFV